MFTTQIKDHFENPRNSGEVSNPDASVLLDNPVCGDILQLTLRVSHDRIEEIRFRAHRRRVQRRANLRGADQACRSREL